MLVFISLMLGWIFIFLIVIINGKIVWKHGPCCWYFRLNLEYLGWLYKSIHQNSKKWQLLWGIAQWKWLWGCLATFCCYDHDAKASQAVQKISTDQKEYHKCSLYVMICWIAKIYLSINVSEKWLFTRIPPT